MMTNSPTLSTFIAYFMWGVARARVKIAYEPPASEGRNSSCNMFIYCVAICAQKNRGRNSRHSPKCASTIFGGKIVTPFVHGGKYKTAAITKLRSKVATNVVRSTCHINLHASRTSVGPCLFAARSSPMQAAVSSAPKCLDHNASLSIPLMFRTSPNACIARSPNVRSLAEHFSSFPFLFHHRRILNSTT